MRSRRGATRDRDIASGPARLTQAMAIGRELDGASLAGPELRVTRRDREILDADIAVSARIGVGGALEAAHWPLRFYLAGNQHVSRGRPT
jgi:DNA-3-methyladenine glycosylase